ncbi:ECF transporter S component [Arthrobacter sp. JZ12]|uniref:ECF transporter S component n=1 Tax=Arthrobacter sp. JZ12 TaxID=2654190 RepID=UPI002B46288D|nr:ECF transporter S component [Arthrobacter sp. JZ12]WRH24127.1 ECF transporter S component [Arthrobacter sp. JZ12]
MNSSLTLPAESAAPSSRPLLIAAGGALIAATYVWLVLVQPVQVADGAGSGAGLITLLGFLAGGALLVAGILPGLNTQAVVLMPLGIALNVSFGQLAGSLGLPIYLDALGTVLVAVLAGPAAGAATGALSNALWGLFNPFALPFAAGSAVIGVLAGVAARWGMFRRLYLVPVAGLLTGVVGGLIAAPVAAFMFGAAGTVGTNAIVAAFRAMGDTLIVAATKQGLTSDTIDKLIVFTVVALIVYALPRRTRNSFAFVRSHRVLLSRTAPATTTADRASAHPGSGSAPGKK